MAGEDVASWKDLKSNLELKKAKLGAFLATQKVVPSSEAYKRDAQSPRFSWIPEYRFTNSYSMELDLGVTPTRKYPDESLFYLINVNLNFNFEIYWNLGIYLTVGAQAWPDNGGTFATFGGGLFYQFKKPFLWVVDKLYVGYSIVPTPKTTNVIEFGTVLKF